MKYKLGDIAPIKQGTVEKNDEYWLLNLDMVESNTGHIIDYLTVRKEKIGSSTVAFDTENILYSRLRPYLNKVVLPQKCGYATSEMLPLRPNIKVISKEYLTCFLRSLKFVEYISEKTSGAKMPRVNISDLKNVEIDCPSLEMQKKITESYDKLLSIIALRKQELEALDDLIRARFVEMFGDRYVNDMKWSTGKLGDMVTFNNGKAHEQVIDENGKYILVTSRAIASDFKDVRKTSNLLFPLHEKDIVMVMSDVPNGKALAKCQLIDSDNKYTLNQRICGFNNYEFNPIFLLYLLNRHPYFLEFNDGNGQTNLRKNDILECELIIPPLDLQSKFSDFVNQINKSKLTINQKPIFHTPQSTDNML